MQSSRLLAAGERRITRDFMATNGATKVRRILTIVPTKSSHRRFFIKRSHDSNCADIKFDRYRSTPKGTNFLNGNSATMDHFSRMRAMKSSARKRSHRNLVFARDFPASFLLTKKKRCTDTLQNLLASCSSGYVSGSEKQSINAATNIKN